MKARRMHIIASALLLLLASKVNADEKQWLPPVGGVIRDKVAAKSIARAIWFSVNPSLKKSSEQAWQKGMEADRDGNIWRVREKSLGKDYLGGGLEIDLNATDGRVLRILVVQ